MGKRRFPVEAGSCHEGVEKGSDRDDLIEAGRQLVKAKARESKASNLGVKAGRKAWHNRYPKGGKVKHK